MKILGAVARDLLGLAISIWWMAAGMVLLMFVVATTPWLIDHSEKAKWIPLAYLIWGLVGCVALVVKANKLAMRTNYFVTLMRNRRAERELIAADPLTR